MQRDEPADTGNEELAIKGNHQEAKPDTCRLFSLLGDNRQQQEHWKISVPSNKDAVSLAEPKEPEEEL